MYPLHLKPCLHYSVGVSNTDSFDCIERAGSNDEVEGKPTNHCQRQPNIPSDQLSTGIVIRFIPGYDEVLKSRIFRLTCKVNLV